MTRGYIYALTNDAMPGVVKIGRTERDPVDRARKLRTTGVPAPFKLLHFCLVDDCQAAEGQIHRALVARGVRTLPDREFFEITEEDAIQLLDLMVQQQASSSIDFTRQAGLSELVHAIPLPIGRELISEDRAEHLVKQLATLGRRGYPNALKYCAEIYEINYVSAILFREFWQEYLELAKQEAESRAVPSGGHSMRNAVGKDVAEYLHRMSARGWLLPVDFSFVSSFLVSGDRFVYEGYLEEVHRPGFSTIIRDQAASL